MNRNPSNKHNVNDDPLELVSGAVVDIHYWLFLMQAIGCGLLFLIWQINELEQPWFRGPWHFIFLGWLVIYGGYLSYASRRHEITSATTDARASDLSDADKLVAWYERAMAKPRMPPWWLRFPLLVLSPLLVVVAAVFGLYRIAIDPRTWPEAAAFVAAIIAILIVPTFGVGPLLIMGAHIAAVIWLRSSTSQLTAGKRSPKESD